MRRRLAQLLHNPAIFANIAFRDSFQDMEIRISDELNNIIRYAREEAMRTGS